MRQAYVGAAFAAGPAGEAPAATAMPSATKRRTDPRRARLPMDVDDSPCAAVDHGRAIQSPAGAEYDVIVEVAWDDQPLGAGVVRGTIDDHGWKACEDVYEIFSKDPDGRIVGIPGRRFHSRRGDNPKVTRPGIEPGIVP